MDVSGGVEEWVGGWLNGWVDEGMVGGSRGTWVDK